MLLQYGGMPPTSMPNGPDAARPPSTSNADAMMNGQAPGSVGPVDGRQSVGNAPEGIKHSPARKCSSQRNFLFTVLFSQRMALQEVRQCRTAATDRVQRSRRATIMAAMEATCCRKRKSPKVWTSNNPAQGPAEKG